MSRERFDQQLQELRDEILRMGDMVKEEMQLALTALDKLDKQIARQVNTADERVNGMRFAIEERCFSALATQQPTARDLRAIVAVMNMIVDLERMGDQAKGIAKAVRRLVKGGEQIAQPAELQQMGNLVLIMLDQTMTAYQNDDVALATGVAAQDDRVDDLFATVFSQLMAQMAESNLANKVEASYEVLRAARELERFGDLATNIAERVVYRVTGEFRDMNEEDPNA